MYWENGHKSIAPYSFCSYIKASHRQLFRHFIFKVDLQSPVSHILNQSYHNMWLTPVANLEGVEPAPPLSPPLPFPNPRLGDGPTPSRYSWSQAAQ